MFSSRSPERRAVSAPVTSPRTLPKTIARSISSHFKRSSSEASIKLRAEDPRYHMGSYGTCHMDSIHGRLFELQVFVDSLKFHTMMYFAFTLFSVLLAPIAALLAIPVSFMAGRDKDMHIFKLILVLATFLFVVLWTTPSLIVLLGGGMSHFKKLITVDKQITYLDFVDMFLSEFMILLTVVFSWVYHEISLDVQKYKESTKASWRRRHQDHGLFVDFQEDQVEHFRSIIHKPDGADSKEEVENGGSLFIEEIIQILETLPGWNSELKNIEDYWDKKFGIEKGLYSDLARLSTEASTKKIWPIDIWLVRSQYYLDEGEEPMGFYVGFVIAFYNTTAMLMGILNFLKEHKHRLVLLTVLSCIRTMLPRFWLKYVNNGSFFPQDPAAASMVVYSTIMTFVVGFCWMGLFFGVLMDYRHNLVQMVGISALVDPNKRVVYSQFYLMSAMYFGMGPEECEQVLSRLPLLDLRLSNSVAAFWRIREYTVLDCANERMAISILLEIVIIWMTLKFLVTVGVMYASSTLPAVLSVTLFDLLVFGVMIIIALETALKMNGILDEHKRVFVEGEYMCSMALANESVSGGSEAKVEDLKLSRKMLTQFIDMVNEYDTRDQILFGMTITGGKILSSAFTVGAAIATLLREMIQAGKLKVPDEIEDQFVSQVAVPATATAFNHTVHLLSNIVTSFHGKVHMS